MMLALPEGRYHRWPSNTARPSATPNYDPIERTRCCRDVLPTTLAPPWKALRPGTGCTLVGWIMAGGVLLQYLLGPAGPVASLTLVDPCLAVRVSADQGKWNGLLCDPGAPGSGGGAA